jgi:adenosylmethionine-8-amino-7-oxononanoate aminotransferase
VLREVANKRQGSKELKVFEDERVVTLEHIMPKTRTKEWVKAAKDEEAYLAHVHRIGNLALIEREKNRATSTASFAKKKEDAFSQSGILLTRDLCKYSEWTVAEIVTRQAELAKLAARAWRLPY